MERSVKEEQVTKSLLKWLCGNGWEIICYDFPQSGTGRILHPSNSDSKTYGSIIPDIIAIKDGVVVDFENKDKFVKSDFDKIYFIKSSGSYKLSFDALLKGKTYNKIYYGIGMPFNENNYAKAEREKTLVDFIVYLQEDGTIKISENNSIF